MYMHRRPLEAFIAATRFPTRQSQSYCYNAKAAVAGDSIFMYTTVYIITFFNLHAQGCCKLHTEDLHYLKSQSGRIITHSSCNLSLWCDTCQTSIEGYSISPQNQMGVPFYTLLAKFSVQMAVQGRLPSRLTGIHLWSAVTSSLYNCWLSQGKFDFDLVLFGWLAVLNLKYPQTYNLKYHCLKVVFYHK